jgi:7-cyano-7-deazaguanine synthase
MGGSDDTVNETSIRSKGKQLAVCLVSGGMDSCVTAAIANEENDEIAFLHVSYGQRTARRERKSFEEIADYYGVKLSGSFPDSWTHCGSSPTDRKIPVAVADLNFSGHTFELCPLETHLVSRPRVGER